MWMPPAHDVDQKIPAKFLREFEVKRIIIVDKKKKIVTGPDRK